MKKGLKFRKLFYRMQTTYLQFNVQPTAAYSTMENVTFLKIPLYHGAEH